MPLATCLVAATNGPKGLLPVERVVARRDSPEKGGTLDSGGGNDGLARREEKSDGGGLGGCHGALDGVDTLIKRTGLVATEPRNVLPFGKDRHAPSDGLTKWLIGNDLWLGYARGPAAIVREIFLEIEARHLV